MIGATPNVPGPDKDGPGSWCAEATSNREEYRGRASMGFPSTAVDWRPPETTRAEVRGKGYRELFQDWFRCSGRCAVARSTTE